MPNPDSVQASHLRQTTFGGIFKAAVLQLSYSPIESNICSQFSKKKRIDKIFLLLHTDFFLLSHAI